MSQKAHNRGRKLSFLQHLVPRYARMRGQFYRSNGHLTALIGMLLTTTHTQKTARRGIGNATTTGLGVMYEDWLNTLKKVFLETYRVTLDGGFCAIVMGTILHKGKHYPRPFRPYQYTQRYRMELPPRYNLE